MSDNKLTGTQQNLRFMAEDTQDLYNEYQGVLAEFRSILISIAHNSRYFDESFMDGFLDLVAEYQTDPLEAEFENMLDSYKKGMADPENIEKYSALQTCAGMFSMIRDDINYLKGLSEEFNGCLDQINSKKPRCLQQAKQHFNLVEVYEIAEDPRAPQSKTGKNFKF